MRKRKGLKAQMREWNAASREMQAAAKRASEYRAMGLVFTVTARFAESCVAEANAWMAANPRHGVIAVTGGEILIAHKDDEGRRP